MRLSSPWLARDVASFPQEFDPSCPALLPAEPNPILELHDLQSFSLLLMMPILVMAGSCVPVDETTLKPSILQFIWSMEPCKSDFHVSLPTVFCMYLLFDRSAWRETAFWLTSIQFICWSKTRIPRQSLVNGLLQKLGIFVSRLSSPYSPEVWLCAILLLHSFALYEKVVLKNK